MVQFAPSQRFAPSYIAPSYSTFTYTETPTEQTKSQSEIDYEKAVRAFRAFSKGQTFAGLSLSGRNQRKIYKDLIRNNREYVDVKQSLKPGRQLKVTRRVKNEPTESIQSITTPAQTIAPAESKSIVKNTIERSTGTVGFKSTLSEPSYISPINVKDIQTVDASGKVTGGGSVKIVGVDAFNVSNEQAIESFRTGKPITITRTETRTENIPLQNKSFFGRLGERATRYVGGQGKGALEVIEFGVNFYPRLADTFAKSQRLQTGNNPFYFSDVTPFKIVPDRLRSISTPETRAGEKSVILGANILFFKGVGSAIGGAGFTTQGGLFTLKNLGAVGLGVTTTARNILFPIGQRTGFGISTRTNQPLTFLSERGSNFQRLQIQESSQLVQIGNINPATKTGRTIGVSRSAIDVYYRDAFGRVKTNSDLSIFNEGLGKPAGTRTEAFNTFFRGVNEVNRPFGKVQIGTSNKISQGFSEFTFEGKKFIITEPVRSATTQTRAFEQAPNVFYRETGTLSGNKLTVSEIGNEVRIGRGGYKLGDEVGKLINEFRPARSTYKIPPLNKRGQLTIFDTRIPQTQLLEPSQKVSIGTSQFTSTTSDFSSFTRTQTGGALLVPGGINPFETTITKTDTFTTTLNPSRQFQLTPTTTALTPTTRTTLTTITQPTLTTITPSITSTLTTITPTVTTTLTPTPPGLIGFNYAGGGGGFGGFFPGGDLFGGLGGNIKTRRKYKRQPSFFAQYFNIRSKRASIGEITGLIERPII